MWWPLQKKKIELNDLMGRQVKAPMFYVPSRETDFVQHLEMN